MIGRQQLQVAHVADIDGAARPEGAYGADQDIEQIIDVGQVLDD